MNEHNPSRLSRRKALGLLGAVGVASIAGCAGGGDEGGTNTNANNTTSSTANNSSTSTTTNTSVSTSTNTSSSAGSCTLIPQETVGPYPLSAILSNTAMQRLDITEGKTGVPLTLEIQLQNINNACQPLANAYVYIWHCDKEGLYSGYNQPGGNSIGQTFLRGIGLTNAQGKVSFSTIYPGWYNGRITHVHFQIFLLDPNQTATATSQIAFPESVTTAVYNSALYAARGQNTSVASFAQDNVFSDGTTYQMASLTGGIEQGLVAALVVSVAV